MRSSFRFLDIAKNGINSPGRWLKVELFAFLWTFPSAIFLIPLAVTFKGNGRGEAMMAAIQPPALALACMLLPFVTALYGLCRQIPRQHNRHWLTIITPNASINWSKVCIGAAVWGIVLLADVAMNYIFSPERFTWSFQPVQWLMTLIVAVVMIPLQAGFEELAFRGYTMQMSALVSKRVWQPLIITSVCFGLLHYANPEVKAYGPIMMINYIGIGGIFGIATLMDDGLELAVGAHAINNILTALLVTETNYAFQTSALFKVTSEQPTALWLCVDTALPGAVFLVVLAKIYKWGSWKRLFTVIWDISEPEIEAAIPDASADTMNKQILPE